jgi:hypothetical protein
MPQSVTAHLTQTNSLPIKGAPGSPYSRKLMAVLRYRRIAFQLLSGMQADAAGLPKPKAELYPTVYLPDADGVMQALTDSTPLIRRFEGMFSGRSVIPADPVLGFLDSLLEDFADEWVCKPMYHYRWSNAADSHKASSTIPLQHAGVAVTDAMAAAMRKGFADRQISRLSVVGSNLHTAALIEASYLRLLDLLEAHLRDWPFLMGKRPGASDFALYGQLTQLCNLDPTPTALALARAPRVVAWAGWLDDLSGLECDASGWLDSAKLPHTLLDLLRELARGYVPVTLANARAVLAGQSSLEASVDGAHWTQATVPYQAKCLQWLRQEFGQLAPADRATAHSFLADAGCADLVDAGL